MRAEAEAKAERKRYAEKARIEARMRAEAETRAERKRYAEKAVPVQF